MKQVHLIDKNGKTVVLQSNLIHEGDMVFQFKRISSKIEQVEENLDGEVGKWGWVDVTDEVKLKKVQHE